MKSSTLTIFTIVFIIAIAVFQSYIVYNIYILQKKSLAKELDVVLDSSYKEYLNLRLTQMKESKDISISLYEESDMFKYEGSKDTLVYYDLDQTEVVDKSNLVDILNIAVREYANANDPIDLVRLDTMVNIALRGKNISSYFVLRIVDTEELTKEQSKPFHEGMLDFSVYSQKIALDLNQTAFLELMLVNPQGDIFKRLFITIFSCVFFSLFCIYSIRSLENLINRQRKLTTLKNDFFGQISHELKRPLTQLHMAIHSLSDKFANNTDDPKLGRYLDIAGRASEDISSKIDMIMALSMEEEGVFRLKYSEFDLHNAIASMLERIEMTASKSVRINLINELAHPNIRADKDHLLQCVANLVENSIKYSKKSVEIQVRLYSQNNRTVIAVKDNGLGIEDDLLSRLFLKYDRLDQADSKVSGFGIGLNYVQKMIEKHGGNITVESKLGIGSEFFISLPS